MKSKLIKIREIAGRRAPAVDSRKDGKRVNLLLSGVVVVSAIAPLFLTDPFVAFIFGVWVGAIALGTLWLLRERERARAFKAQQAQIEMLQDRDRRQGMLIVYLRNTLDNLTGILGGRVTLSVPAKQVGQRQESYGVYAESSLRGGSQFLGREQ